MDKRNKTPNFEFLTGRRRSTSSSRYQEDTKPGDPRYGKRTQSAGPPTTSKATAGEVRKYSGTYLQSGCGSLEQGIIKKAYDDSSSYSASKNEIGACKSTDEVQTKEPNKEKYGYVVDEQGICRIVKITPSTKLTERKSMDQLMEEVAERQRARMKENDEKRAKLKELAEIKQRAKMEGEKNLKK